MAKYCNSEILERNWFEWLVARGVPILEPYREAGTLWTKVIGRVGNGNTEIQRADPNYAVRWHYIAPLRLCTCENVIVWVWCREIMDPISVGYFRERPVGRSWQAMMEDIYAMCRGIASRFKQPTDEARDNLANEAAIQVASKLQRGKLSYTPGQAPVFNLLTTTIHRCIYSALSKEGRHKRRCVPLTDGLCSSLKY